MSQGNLSLEELCEENELQCRKISRLYFQLDAELGEIVIEAYKCDAVFYLSGEDLESSERYWRLLEENYHFLNGCDDALKREIIKKIKDNQNKGDGCLLDDICELIRFIGVISTYVEQFKEIPSALREEMFQDLYDDIRRVNRLKLQGIEREYELYRLHVFMKPMQIELDLFEKTEEINSGFSSFDAKLGRIIAEAQREYLDFLQSKEFREVEREVRDGPEPYLLSTETLIQKREYYLSKGRLGWFSIFNEAELNYLCLEDCSPNLLQEVIGKIVGSAEETWNLEPKASLLCTITAFLNFVVFSHRQQFEEMAPDLRGILFDNLLEDLNRYASERYYRSAFGYDSYFVCFPNAKTDLEIVNTYSWDNDLTRAVLAFDDRSVNRSSLHSELNEFLSKDPQSEQRKLITKIMIERACKFPEYFSFGFSSRCFKATISLLQKIYETYSDYFEGNDLEKGLELFHRINEVVGSGGTHTEEAFYQQREEVFEFLSTELVKVDFSKNEFSVFDAFGFLLDDVFKFLVDERGSRGQEYFGRIFGLLKRGQCQSLEKVAECAQISLQNYQVLKKHTRGGWSNLYLVSDEGEEDEDFIKIMKVPSRNLDTQNVRHIIGKYNSLEEALKQIALEEKRINSKTSNTSRDEFPNFEYRPLPQFFESQLVTIGSTELPALIYEFIDGQTIEDYFKEKRTYQETLKVLAKAAYCLNYIHQKGFTHNDIKSDNFMVGKNGRVYLLDLAFSRAEDSESTIRGVRAYTAPERLGGASPTPESDQYSFGVMAYELLTGSMPINYGDTEQQKAVVASFVQEGKKEPDFNLLKEKTKPNLASVIEKCLSFKPEDRYDSMQDCENDLMGILKETA